MESQIPRYEKAIERLELYARQCQLKADMLKTFKKTCDWDDITTDTELHFTFCHMYSAWCVDVWYMGAEIAHLKNIKLSERATKFSPTSKNFKIVEKGSGSFRIYARKDLTRNVWLI